METRRKIIENTISDLVSDFLYYDRKEDEQLFKGEIEEAVEKGEITVNQIVEKFGEELRKGIN